MSFVGWRDRLGHTRVRWCLNFVGADNGHRVDTDKANRDALVITGKVYRAARRSATGGGIDAVAGIRKRYRVRADSGEFLAAVSLSVVR